MAVDTAGITRPQEVSTSTKGTYEANLATVRCHVALPDGRVVQIMPGNDARAEIPPEALGIVWHERMGKTPQEVALAGAEPVDGSEVTRKASLVGIDDHALAARLAGAETELRRLTELAHERLSGRTLASVEKQIADLRKQLEDPAESAPITPEENPNMPEPDPQKVRTAVKPSPAKP